MPVPFGFGERIHTYNTGKGNPTKSNFHGDEQTRGGHGYRVQYRHHSPKHLKFFFFLMWAIFKAFIESVTILLLFYVLVF